MEQKPNRLIREKSPYLLQHAYNPVDWYAWGDEAFGQARSEGKPIFLSIGYSTCHWCHVMERESFENESIASLLNQFFVPIKVDREERPDVDRIYMSALQAMGQDGGWPLSMFLTPDLKPFWGGTYFPPVARQGRSGFSEILQKIHEIWSKERENVAESADRLNQFLVDLMRGGGVGGEVGPVTVGTCFDQIERTFDQEKGGFGRGAKFPRPVTLSFLLRYYARTGRERALEMVERTIQAMACGGIRDHLGGGFHRYTVDREWRVPHFEKMLYDQALIVTAAVELYQAFKAPLTASVIRETCDYVLREMTHPDGGFYSAEDADSPIPERPEQLGEGAFYLWRKEEIDQVLGSDAELFSLAYGVKERGNVHADPHGEFAGKNILTLRESPESLAERFKVSQEVLTEKLAGARGRLLAVRQARPHPALDDKILASWNGLMIGALARAGATLAEDRYLVAARRGAGFLFSHLYNAWTKTFLRRFRAGESRFAATLQDYAFVINGLVDLYEAVGEIAWLRGAIRMTEEMVEGFWDRERGGFFDTQGSDPSLVARIKEHFDGAEPSGNSMAAFALLRLSEMTGRGDWRGLAEDLFSAFGPDLQKHPVASPLLAAALEFSLQPPTQVVLAGAGGGEDLQRLLLELHRRHIPDKVVLHADGGAGQDELSEMLPFLREMRPLQGKATAYVCKESHCKLPTNDVAVFGHLLEAESGLSPDPDTASRK